jgi:hypothetical protein
MTNYYHRKAIEAHISARDFQSTHCSTIGHHYVQVEPRLQECLRCGHVNGTPAVIAPEPESDSNLTLPLVLTLSAAFVVLAGIGFAHLMGWL